MIAWGDVELDARHGFAVTGHPGAYSMMYAAFTMAQGGVLWIRTARMNIGRLCGTGASFAPGRVTKVVRHRMAGLRGLEKKMFASHRPHKGEQKIAPPEKIYSYE